MHIVRLLNICEIYDGIIISHFFVSVKRNFFLGQFSIYQTAVIRNAVFPGVRAKAKLGQGFEKKILSRQLEH